MRVSLGVRGGRAEHGELTREPGQLHTNSQCSGVMAITGSTKAPGACPTITHSNGRLSASQVAEYSGGQEYTRLLPEKASKMGKQVRSAAQCWRVKTIQQLCAWQSWVRLTSGQRLIVS